MEQIRLALELYSDWIIMGLTGITVIFLVFALHRMKKVQKQIKQLSEKIEQHFRRQEQEGISAEAKILGSMEQRQVSETVKSAEAKKPSEEQSPTELINAVLDEVFP